MRQEIPTSFGGGRFVVEKELGRGGMGVVYEALDQERDMRVALKTLLHMDADSLYYFKREFRSLHDIVHPNLCSFMELIKDEKSWFFTMELIHGANFLSYVHAPGCHFDEDRLRASLSGLCNGLVALHAAGKIHRDIKPSNVMIDEENRVVILDFGLVKENKVKHQLEQGVFIGTVEYMAPEQADNISVGPEADMYSVGVMLYEALTGQLPFRGNAQTIFLEKQMCHPTRPGDIISGLPEDLEILSMDLLNRDPSKRPSPVNILERIDSTKSYTCYPVEPIFAAQAMRPIFVGRQPELHLLRNIYEETISEKDFRAVVLEGVSGIGKSALVEKFTTDLMLAHPSTVVLNGRCYERESTPYKAFDGIVDSIVGLTRSIPLEKAKSLMPNNADLLVRLFPELTRSQMFDKIVPSSSDIADPHAQKSMAFEAFGELLSRLSIQQPLVVILDDMQWADDDSHLLLKSLIDGPASPPLLLLFVSRFSNDIHNSPINWDAPDSTRHRRILLETLDIEETESLVRLLINQQNLVYDAAAKNIASESSGHPLYIAELVQNIGYDLQTCETTRIDEVIWSRIKTMPQEVRQLLRILCVSSRPIERGHLQHIAKMESGEFYGSIVVLRGNNLIRSGGPRQHHLIEPYHDRVREAVVAHDMPMGEAANIHLNIDRFFLSRYSEQEIEENIFFVVRHLFEGKDLLLGTTEQTRLAELLFAAGKKARGSSAFISSLVYFNESIELFSEECWKTDYGTMFELHCSAAESAYITGNFSMAMDLAKKAKSEALTTLDEATIYETYILSRIADGKPIKAIDDAIRMMARLGVRMPHRPSKLYLAMKIFTMKIRLLGKSRDQLLNLPHLRNPRIIAAIRLMTRIADTAYVQLPQLNAMIVIRGIEISLRHGISSFSIPAFAGWGFVNTAYLRNYREGHKYGSIAIDMMQMFQENSKSPMILFICAAFIQHWREHLRESLSHFLRVRHISDKIGERHYYIWSGNNYCYFCLLAGDYLPKVVELFERYDSESGNDTQNLVHNMRCTMHQTALNLIGKCNDPLELTGTAYDGNRMNMGPTGQDQNIPLDALHFCNMFLQVFFNSYRDAYRSACEQEKYADASKGSYRSAVTLLYDSLACLKHHEETDALTKGKLRRRVRKNQRKYKKIARSSPANHAHKYTLVEAERARVKRKYKKAPALYDQAIAGAIEQEFTQDAALACEFAADFYREIGDERMTMAYAKDALGHYEKWGAFAKVEHVKEKFGIK